MTQTTIYKVLGIQGATPAVLYRYPVLADAGDFYSYKAAERAARLWTALENYVQL
jgi:hypothetical protein